MLTDLRRRRVEPEDLLFRARVLGWHRFGVAMADWAGRRVSRRGEVSIIETATGRLQSTIHTGAGREFTFALSPDCKTLAIGCADTTVLIFDLDCLVTASPELPKPANEGDALWELLGDLDPTKAEQAMWTMRHAPSEAMATLGERLQPAKTLQAQDLQRRIAQLDSDDFKTRRASEQALERLGVRALPILRAALKNPASPEQQRRLESLIARMEDPLAVTSCLREIRALEVLEGLGGAKARKLVKRMTTGDQTALATIEALIILKRWPEK